MLETTPSIVAPAVHPTFDQLLCGSIRYSLAIWPNSTPSLRCAEDAVVAPAFNPDENRSRAAWEDCEDVCDRPPVARLNRPTADITAPWRENSSMIPGPFMRRP
jgi:hypothetical protein